MVRDSIFGNKEQVVLAIGNSLGFKENIETYRASETRLEQLLGWDY